MTQAEPISTEAPVSAASPAGPASLARRLASHNGWIALILFTLLVAVYHANWTVMDEGDGVPSTTLPYALFTTGGLSFDPDQFPELFKWKAVPPLDHRDDLYFLSLDEVYGDRSLRGWRNAGFLELNGPRYYIIESKLRNTYVSTFGPIPGLMFAPFALPFYLYDHEIAHKLALKTSVAKLYASSLVAMCAVLIFLICVQRTTRNRALLIAFTYGLGTCAWAVSSQNLWQQTVNQLFLITGAYFLLTHPERTRFALLSGLFFGAATACRATGLIAVVLVLVYLVLHHRKSALPFVLGSLPIPIALLGYNFYYFGSPFALAQALAGHAIAVEKTGSPDLWQTPFTTGLAGLLVSPSRGLLVFSPLLAASFVGGLFTFERPELRYLRPLTAAAGLTMALQCKWFDWWGGWAYGYRPWIDELPYLCLLLLPVVDDMTKTAPRRVIYGGLLAWSMAVQALGAMAYDRTWNNRLIFVTRVPGERRPLSFTTEKAARDLAEAKGGTYLGTSLCDIDLSFCRHRLWSLEDSIIYYHLTNYRATRARRLKPSWDQLGSS